jgi:DNA-binding CsgD family transcriptional regulator
MRAKGMQIREEKSCGRTSFASAWHRFQARGIHGRPELSERELQVLQYMALGRSNKEIGQVLYISENTMKGHVKSILKKLDAIGRTEAIAIANRCGLIQTS